MKEFKVGDRLECIAEKGVGPSYDLILGDIYIVRKVFDDGCIGISGTSGGYHGHRFKLANSATKPKATKENNMNTSIESVFEKDTVKDGNLVQKHFGSEIAEDFTGALNLQLHKENYLTEAKRREKAEKEAK